MREIWDPEQAVGSGAYADMIEVQTYWRNRSDRLGRWRNDECAVMAVEER
jgi:hypothetical protein